MTFIALDVAQSLASPQTPGVIYISQFNLCIVCSPGLHSDHLHKEKNKYDPFIQNSWYQERQYLDMWNFERVTCMYYYCTVNLAEF